MGVRGRATRPIGEAFAQARADPDPGTTQPRFLRTTLFTDPKKKGIRDAVQNFYF